MLESCMIEGSSFPHFSKPQESKLKQVRHRELFSNHSDGEIEPSRI